MAILHRAYRFSSTQFIGTVLSFAAEGGGVDADRLRAHARQLIEHEAIATEVLGDLRYVPEWLAPDVRADRLRESLALVLGEHLRRVPSLSDDRPEGPRILRVMLAHAGWTAEEIAMLLEGRPLHLLIERVPLPQFARTFRGFDVFGGWIPEADVLLLATRIAEVRGRSEEERQLIDDAARMLAVAARHQSALLVILD